MGEAALSLEPQECEPQEHTPELHLVASEKTQSTPFTYINFLVVVLILVQILDGVLTGLGVSQFGIEAEGNPLLRFFMGHFGHEATLIGAKSLSIAIVILLGHCAKSVAWVEKAMTAVACLYIFAALIPWTFILTARFVLI
ncbi:MAG: hypothetical protein KDD70_14120 [Bdellovibrionales bacterium]|nr:hypothetical protein [Bdellovibrionales bacterium]